MTFGKVKLSQLHATKAMVAKEISKAAKDIGTTEPDTGKARLDAQTLDKFEVKQLNEPTRTIAKDALKTVKKPSLGQAVDRAVDAWKGTDSGIPNSWKDFSTGNPQGTHDAVDALNGTLIEPFVALSGLFKRQKDAGAVLKSIDKIAASLDAGLRTHGLLSGAPGEEEIDLDQLARRFGSAQALTAEDVASICPELSKDEVLVALDLLKAAGAEGSTLEVRAPKQGLLAKVKYITRGHID